MAHDVFISHSSINKKAADAICHALEQNGVKCWIAPRDIPPGANYGGEIIKGIKNCKVFLLVFSKEANASPAVAKEVERAVLGYKKTVIPFRIEDVAMSENLEFFLTDVHWLDAFPNDKVFDTLVTAVKNALGIPACSDGIESIREVMADRTVSQQQPIALQNNSNYQTSKERFAPIVDNHNTSDHIDIDETVTADIESRQMSSNESVFSSKRNTPNSNVASIKVVEPLSKTPSDKLSKPIPQTNTATPTVQNAHNLELVERYPNVLQPVGTAVITRRDGTAYTVPANYILVKTYNEIYEGVAKYYNGAFPIYRFSDLRRIENENAEDRHFNCELEKLDGTKETIAKETGSEFLAVANGNSLVTIPWSELKSIAFDWNKSCESGCDYVYVYCHGGETYCLPAPFFFFGHRIRPDADAMGWDSSIHWGDVFITDKNQSIYSNRLASVEFLEVEIDPAKHKSFNRWLKRCIVSFKMKDGRSLKATLGMASLHFISVDGFGVFEIKVENIQRIVFDGENDIQP